MSKEEKFKLSVEEGQQLLLICHNFALGEKLGDTPYNVMDRALATEEVRALYRELRSRSPLMHRPERWLLFGPGDNYQDVKGTNGNVGHQTLNLALEVEVSLSEEALSGAMWCLLAALHPASGQTRGAGLQEDVFWPLARKLGLSKAIRKEIKLEEAKPRRWERDAVIEEAAKA